LQPRDSFASIIMSCVGWREPGSGRRSGDILQGCLHSYTSARLTKLLCPCRRPQARRKYRLTVNETMLVV
jgi:hypothetical protein